MALSDAAKAGDEKEEEEKEEEGNNVDGDDAAAATAVGLGDTAGDTDEFSGGVVAAAEEDADDVQEAQGLGEPLAAAARLAVELREVLLVAKDEACAVELETALAERVASAAGVPEAVADCTSDCVLELLPVALGEADVLEAADGDPVQIADEDADCVAEGAREELPLDAPDAVAAALPVEPREALDEKEGSTVGESAEEPEALLAADCDAERVPVLVTPTVPLGEAAMLPEWLAVVLADASGEEEGAVVADEEATCDGEDVLAIEREGVNDVDAVAAGVWVGDEATVAVAASVPETLDVAAPLDVGLHDALPLAVDV